MEPLPFDLKLWLSVLAWYEHTFKVLQPYEGRESSFRSAESLYRPELNEWSIPTILIDEYRRRLIQEVIRKLTQ